MPIATQAMSTCTFRDRAKAAIGLADVTTTSVLPIQYRGGYDVALIPSTAPRYMFDMEWLGWKIHRYVGTHTRLHIGFRSSRH